MLHTHDRNVFALASGGEEETHQLWNTRSTVEWYAVRVDCDRHAAAVKPIIEAALELSADRKEIEAAIRAVPGLDDCSQEVALQEVFRRFVASRPAPR